MSKNVFDSRVMTINVDGSTVRYAYLKHPEDVYEIRNVSQSHLAALRSTIGHPVWSSSATVQRLTQLYAKSHYKGTKLVKPSSKKLKLTKKTPLD